jgi:hypothetical protein
MSVHFVQYWDVIEEKEEAYARFVEDRFIPACNALGLQSVGGFYVQVGGGHQIASIKKVESPEAASRIISGPDFTQLRRELKAYVSAYSSKLQRPTLRTDCDDYVIQKDVWKFNHYYTVRPGSHDGHTAYVRDAIIPFMDTMEGVTFTELWEVIIGGLDEYVMEFTFKHPADIGMLLENGDFRRRMHALRRDHVKNLKNLILRTTARYHEPQWFRL